MLVVKKQQVVIVALVALIAIAGYLNWSYQRELNTTDQLVEEPTLGEATMVENVDKKEENDFFAQARLDRELSRNKAIETLNLMIENKGMADENKVSAEQEVIAIARNTDKESAIEGLIKAKGFVDAVVYINEDKANVITKATSAMTSQDAAKIYDIVTGQTGIKPAGIKIIEAQ